MPPYLQITDSETRLPPPTTPVTSLVSIHTDTPHQLPARRLSPCLALVTALSDRTAPLRELTGLLPRGTATATAATRGQHRPRSRERWMDRSALHPGPALTSHPAYCSPAHVIRGAGRCETKKKRSRPFTSTTLISGRGTQSTNTEHVTRQEGIWGGRVHSENNGMMQLAPVRRRGGRAGQ